MNHDHMIAIIEAHKKDWRSVEVLVSNIAFRCYIELSDLLSKLADDYTYRIIPPKPKMVKWYGWMDAGCAVRLMTTEFLTPPWKRLPHLDCELPE